MYKTNINMSEHYISIIFSKSAYARDNWKLEHVAQSNMHILDKYCRWKLSHITYLSFYYHWNMEVDKWDTD